MIDDTTSKTNLYVRYVQNIYNMTEQNIMRSHPRQLIYASFSIYLYEVIEADQVHQLDQTNFKREFDYG